MLSVIKSDIAIITVKMLIIIVLFIALANLNYLFKNSVLEDIWV